MNVCICTVIKDEQEYLEDWLKYNIEIGVDKIYIVEDIGTLSHENIVSKYSEHVEILSFEFNEEMLDNFKCKTRQNYFQTKLLNYVRNLGVFDWCLIMDIDEYITITENDLSLKNLLNQYSDYTELIIYWKNYGANGHIEKPDYTKVSSYREYYTTECGYSISDARFTHIMKKAINLNKISPYYRFEQHFHTTSGYIKTNFQQGIRKPCFDRIYLKHYITKSLEEYLWKLLKRGMCCNNHRKINDFFEMNPDMRDKYNEIYRFIDNEQENKQQE